MLCSNFDPPPDTGVSRGGALAAGVKQYSDEYVIQLGVHGTESAANTKRNNIAKMVVEKGSTALKNILGTTEDAVKSKISVRQGNFKNYLYPYSANDTDDNNKNYFVTIDFAGTEFGKANTVYHELYKTIHNNGNASNMKDYFGVTGVSNIAHPKDTDTKEGAYRDEVVKLIRFYAFANPTVTFTYNNGTLSGQQIPGAILSNYVNPEFIVMKEKPAAHSVAQKNHNLKFKDNNLVEHQLLTDTGSFGYSSQGADNNSQSPKFKITNSGVADAYPCTSTTRNVFRMDIGQFGDLATWPSGLGQGPFYLNGTNVGPNSESGRVQYVGRRQPIGMMSRLVLDVDGSDVLKNGTTVPAMDSNGYIYPDLTTDSTKFLPWHWNVPLNVPLCIVTWKNADDTLETDSDVYYGTKPSYDTAEPTKMAEGVTYTFVGWSTDPKATTGTLEANLPEVTQDVTYYAVFDFVTNIYSVTFVDHDGTVLDQQDVAYGGAAVAPAQPTRADYNFVGWDKDFSYITGNLVVTAQYVPVQIIADIPQTGDSSSLALWLGIGMLSILGFVMLRRKYVQ